MRNRSTAWPRVLVVCAVMSALTTATRAEEFLGLQMHGFGGWYYGRSNGPQFVEAAKGGNAQTAQLALNLAAKPADRFRVVTQVNLAQSGAGQKVVLDYAFVDYELSSRLKLRAGRAKHPWGIYGEVFDVGTARPLMHLSQAVYGPVGFTAKAYNGVGVTGSLGGGGRWGLDYDAYGGEIDGDYEDSGLFSMQSSDLPTKFSFHYTDKDVFGLRAKVNTPVQGLWVGGSAYVGTENVTGFNVRQKWAYLGSGEYENERLLVRGESGYFDAEKEYTGNARYLEVAYKITPRWQLATRWDQFHLKLYSFENVPVPPWLAIRYNVRSTEKIVGLNYWVNPSVVLRGSFSQVKGPRLLYPSSPQLQSYIDTGVPPKDKANVFLVGVQFSF